MNRYHWYRAVLVENLMQFQSGERVFTRIAEYAKGPLTVGRVYILFRPPGRVVRFSEKLGPVRSIIRLVPNNQNPEPTTERENSLIEEAYREYMKLHPPPKRVLNKKFASDKFPLDPTVFTHT